MASMERTQSLTRATLGKGSSKGYGAERIIMGRAGAGGRGAWRYLGVARGAAVLRSTP